MQMSLCASLLHCFWSAGSGGGTHPAKVGGTRVGSATLLGGSSRLVDPDRSCDPYPSMGSRFGVICYH